MQAIYGQREHRASVRAQRWEVARPILVDLGLMTLLIGTHIVAGVCR